MYFRDNILQKKNQQFLNIYFLFLLRSHPPSCLSAGLLGINQALNTQARIPSTSQEHQPLNKTPVGGSQILENGRDSLLSAVAQHKRMARTCTRVC